MNYTLALEAILKQALQKLFRPNVSRVRAGTLQGALFLFPRLWAVSVGIYFKKTGSLTCTLKMHTHAPRARALNQHEPPPLPEDKLQVQTALLTGDQGSRSTEAQFREKVRSGRDTWESGSHTAAKGSFQGHCPGSGCSSPPPLGTTRLALGSGFTSSQGAPGSPAGHKAPGVTIVTSHLPPHLHMDPVSLGAGIPLPTGCLPAGLSSRAPILSSHETSYLSE